MQPNKANEKAQAILKAIAQGRSCEQILAGDPSLTYHDIFRSVSEAPTKHWRKIAARAGAKAWQPYPSPDARPVRQRID